MSYEEMEKSKKKQKAQNKSSDGLDLSGKIWQEIDRVLCLPRYHNIKILKVNNSSLATIPLLPHGLEILDLSRNHIERIQGLSHLSFLRVLKLNHNELRRLEGLSKNYQIEELYVSHNHLTQIENLYQLQSLHSLDLRFNQLSHFDLLRRLEDNLNLRVLFVEGNEFAIRAHNFQTFVFQQLPFLTIVDGKSVHQALANKSNYYKQQRQKKMAQKRRNSASDLSSSSSVISDTASSVKPRYMKATICKKLKTGYTAPQRNQHDSKKMTRSRSHKMIKMKNTASRKSLKLRDRASRDRSSGNSTKRAMMSTATAPPSSWMNFNHYSMKPKASRKKPSIYDYSTPKHHKHRGNNNKNNNTTNPMLTVMSPVSSLPEPDMDSNSSCPAIPIATKNNLTASQRTKKTKQMIHELTRNSMNGRNVNDDSNSLKNFGSRNQAKTKMQDVIKKLNEKINKLYSWHLVEIDLVSKQQMQLNEIRSELSTTRESLAQHVTSVSGSMATPLRLLSTPRSATSGMVLDLLGSSSQKQESDNLSSMTSRSALQLNNPDFIKNTLQKCYEILKQDNATTTELEAVENLVLQLESDMAANAQLESLQKKQRTERGTTGVNHEAANTEKDTQTSIVMENEANTTNPDEKKEDKKNEQNEQITQTEEEEEDEEEKKVEAVNEEKADESNGSSLADQVQLEIDAVSESLDLRSETNSMIEQFNAYNQEINKLERELKNIDISHGSSDVLFPNNHSVNCNVSVMVNEQKKYETKQTMTQSFDVEAAEMENAEMQQKMKANKVRKNKSLTAMEKERMDSWLSELADELNTAKMSLKHLMDISSKTASNRSAKVKEFNIVATKCDMFSSFDISSEIRGITENKLSMDIQIAIQEYLHDLQMTKDAIQKLIFHVVQTKDEHSIADQRRQIEQKKLIGPNVYEISLGKIRES